MTKDSGLTDLLVPTYIQMLKALSDWLDKGAAHAAEPEELLAQRLAPDMFPLATQIRFCCVQSYEAVARLRGEPFPDIWAQLIEEGRNAGENPGTLQQAKAHLEAAQAFLADLPSQALDAAADRQIAVDLPDGRIFDMTGAAYARDWALPHFYFHLMTAYGILRAAGAPLGKADYVQHAFAYLRPGTAPAP